MSVWDVLLGWFGRRRAAPAPPPFPPPRLVGRVTVRNAEGQIVPGAKATLDVDDGVAGFQRAPAPDTARCRPPVAAGALRDSDRATA
jgi:hypothetical protein